MFGFVSFVLVALVFAVLGEASKAFNMAGLLGSQAANRFRQKLGSFRGSESTTEMPKPTVASTRQFTAQEAVVQKFRSAVDDKHEFVARMLIDLSLK